MKEKDGVVNFPEQQVILYVEKEDGNYGPMQTGSYISGHYMDDYEIKRYSLEQSLRTRLISGEISIISYFMTLEDLTVAELASRVGLRKSTVRKHLDPVKFGKVRLETIRKYADVFNVPLPNLLQVSMILRNGEFESWKILEETKTVEGYVQESTKNPFVTLVKIGEKTA